MLRNRVCACVMSASRLAPIAANRCSSATAASTFSRSRRVRLEKGFLPGALRLGACEVGLNRVLACLCRCDLGVAGFIPAALARKIRESCRSRWRRLFAIAALAASTAAAACANGRREVIIFELNQNVTFVYLLVVADLYLANQARDLGTQRRDISAYKGIIGALFNATSLPGIPVVSDCEDDGHRPYNYKNRSSVFLPRWLRGWRDGVEPAKALVRCESNT